MLEQMLKHIFYLLAVTIIQQLFIWKILTNVATTVCIAPPKAIANTPCLTASKRNKIPQPF